MTYKNYIMKNGKAVPFEELGEEEREELIFNLTKRAAAVVGYEVTRKNDKEGSKKVG